MHHVYCKINHVLLTKWILVTERIREKSNHNERDCVQIQVRNQDGWSSSKPPPAPQIIKDSGGSSGGSRISQRRGRQPPSCGRQPIILVNFPQKLLENGKNGPVRGGGVVVHVPGIPSWIHQYPPRLPSYHAPQKTIKDSSERRIFFNAILFMKM